MIIYRRHLHLWTFYDSGAQDITSLPIWAPVGAEYVQLLDVVAPWVGT